MRGYEPVKSQKNEVSDLFSVQEQPGMEDLYLCYKGYAFSIAYRMLGSVADAEDAVQDCFAELQRRDRSGIVNMKAYLAKGITNRCLNLLHSARSLRETYIGEWLPEPVSGPLDGPEEAAERKESLSYAFLVMLERLSPTERAVFILREAFQYDYGAIAEMLDRSEGSCRQLFSRARRRLQTESSGQGFDRDQESSRERLLDRFTAAFAAYDVSGLLQLLAEHPVLIADGGGENVHTILRPMAGRKGVAALLTSRRVLRQLHQWRTEAGIINGELQILFKDLEEVKAVLCLNLNKGGKEIQNLYLVMDPGKLGHV
ncbi:RNA polymerase subunit sigma [Paenibacillus sp. PK3_47]|uniref:sigma-70 family RNA polymerase sigma factor n=1 Tax=Paenibacillus sp. PK3_47 TaxID=2072642 RepID=UPI00201D49DC|nr:sigma-70 family RNA polymerase sigma factor [Paenibacillus sp. PK3_47]UQZ32315.1 RNA polymerase subunit sigma [Paenibacillus sp. PK3_47]